MTNRHKDTNKFTLRPFGHQLAERLRGSSPHLKFRHTPGSNVAGSLLTTLRSCLPGLLAGAAYIVYLLVYFEPGSVFEYDPDEGYTLMKAAVLSQGFHFYSDIWSDQPPLFSYILWAVFTQYGWKVVVARVVVTIFSGALIFCIYDTLRRAFPGIQGHVAAVTAVVLLVYTNYFNELSVSAMVGMPSVSAMTGAAFCLVIFHHNQKKRGLIGAGICMGISIGIKLFTVFLIPVLFLFTFGASLLHYRQAAASFRFRGALRHAVTDGGILLAALLAAGILALWPALITTASATLWTGHWSLRNASASLQGGTEVLFSFITEDPLIFLMAILGAWRAIWRRNVEMGLFAAWITAAVLVLWNYYPIWVHHRVLLTIPAAVLSGFAVSELMLLFGGQTATKQRRWLAFAPVAILLAAIPLTDARVRNTLQPATSWTDQEEEEKVQRLIDKYGKSGSYMVTSRQMYAFRAGMPVPPNLAETSVKRFLAELIDKNAIIQSIRKYQPRIVVLSRRWPYPVRQAVIREIKKKYRLVLLRPEGRKTEVWVQRRHRKKRSETVSLP